MAGRELFRQEAKKLYKEQVKKIPKKNRIPFADFYKKYKELKNNEHEHHHETDTPVSDTEDFDFENLVNVNEISDDELEVEEADNMEIVE